MNPTNIPTYDVPYGSEVKLEKGNTTNKTTVEKEGNVVKIKLGREEETPMDAKNIPDIEALTQTVGDVLEYISTDEMIMLEASNETLFKQSVQMKFQDFVDNYFCIYKLLVDRKDREHNLTKLLNLFHTMQQIKDGKRNLNSEYQKFTEQQNQEYIYNQFGGKNKFEQEMHKRHKR